MRRQNIEIGEALQTELVRQVMALEGREETLRLNNLQLEATVDALTECTSVSRKEIRGIAQELSRTSAIGLQAGESTSQIAFLSLSRSTLVGMGLVAIVCIALVAKTLWPTSNAPGPSGLVSATASYAESDVGIGGTFHRKAMLGSAMADVSVVRVMLMMHYQEHGEFPVTIEELGLEPASMVSSNVKGVKLERDGVIVAQLPEDIGKNKEFKLIPGLVMGGTSFEWNCYSNLSAAILTGTHCKPG